MPNTETIEHWVGEFLSSTQGELEARLVGERTGTLLVAFLQGACGSDIDPADLEEGSIRDGVAIGLAPFQLTDPERQALPDLLQSFLSHMQASGRLSGGEQLGRQAHVTATAHLLKKAVRRPTIKVGPNESCPCGSGKKYKKCCMSA